VGSPCRWSLREHELRGEVEAPVPAEHLRRTHFVTNTRWWPPFCAVLDRVATAVLVVLIAAGVTFHA